jgi:Holliday junction resolvase-like predicted endonuclease
MVGWIFSGVGHHGATSLEEDTMTRLMERNMDTAGVYEELVMLHLSNRPYVFVRLQYSIDGGRAYPDIVAIDLKNRVVTVVEVNTGYNVRNLAERVTDREERWFVGLKRDFESETLINENWSYEVELFVRKDSSPNLKQRFSGEADVVVHFFEDENIAFPWKPSHTLAPVGTA